MKRFLLGICGGILGGILAVGGLVYANNNHYVGFNDKTGINMIPGQWVDGVTAPEAIVISGCSIDTQHGGTNVGSIHISSGGNCTLTVTDNTAAAASAAGIVGYTCTFFDITTSASYLPVFKETANSSTGCTVTGSAATGDTIIYVMFGYGDQ